MAKKFSLKKFVMELSTKHQNVLKTRHVEKQIKTPKQCFENTRDVENTHLWFVFSAFLSCSLMPVVTVSSQYSALASLFVCMSPLRNQYSSYNRL